MDERIISDLIAYGRRGAYYKDWYARAECQIHYAADELRVSPSLLAGLLSAYSPRVQVHRSILYAVHRATMGTHPRGAMSTVRSSVEFFEEHGYLRGPKTEAFRRSLLGDQRSVVLDVWMSVAMGLKQTAFSSTKNYIHYSGLVCAAADELGVTPSQCQAMVWSGVIQSAGLRVSWLTFADILPSLWSK
jgi:hypothetical protein